MTWLELAAMVHVIASLIGLGFLVIAIIWIGSFLLLAWLNERKRNK